MVGGEAEVVGHELVVDHAAVLRQQRARQFRVQRRGGHLVGAHRQQAAGELAVEAVDIGVAGQHQHLAAHFALGGAGDEAVRGFAVFQHLALLVDAPAGGFDGSGQALGQLERVEVGGLRVVEGGLVARAGDPLGQLVAADQAHLVVAPFVDGVCLGLFQQLDPALLHRGPEAADPVVHVEAMALRQLAHLIGSPAHAVPETAGALQAQGLFQRRHIAGPAQQGLPTIAPGRGPGHPAGFQQCHALAGQRQAQAGVQAAEAGADDQDIGVLTARLGRPQGNAAGVGLGVVGADMLGGLLEHGSLVNF
ncbi:hypothetical protein FQZ97_681410 [compost metagenome]